MTAISVSIKKITNTADHVSKPYLKALQKFGLVEYWGRATYSLTAKALDNMHVFEDDMTGSSQTRDSDIVELLKKFGLVT